METLSCGCSQGFKLINGDTCIRCGTNSASENNFCGVCSDNQAECLYCPDGRPFSVTCQDPAQNANSCPAQHFNNPENGFACEACDASCDGCQQDSMQCDKCAYMGAVLDRESRFCECPPDTVLNLTTKRCERCPSSCKMGCNRAIKGLNVILTCKGTTSAEACVDNHVLDAENRCVEDMLYCEENCQNCNDMSSTPTETKRQSCLLCHESRNYFLREEIGNKCRICPRTEQDYIDAGMAFNAETSPIFYVQIDTTTSPNRSVCKTCIPGCATCSNATGCDTCRNGYTKDENNICRIELSSSDDGTCPRGTFKTATGCDNCHPTCGSCHGPDDNQCLSCKPADPTITGSVGFEVYQGVCRCPQGSYSLLSETVCRPCHAECKFCHGPGRTQCTRCMNSGWKPYPKPTETTGGQCINCSELSEQFPTECTSQVYKFEFERIVTKTVEPASRRIDNEDPLPSIPFRTRPKPGVITAITDRIREIVEEDRSVLEKILALDLSPYVEGEDYTKEIQLVEGTNELEVLFLFNQDTEPFKATLTIDDAGALENYSPSTSRTRRLQNVSNPDDPVLVKFTQEFEVQGRSYPTNGQRKFFQTIGYLAMSAMAIALILGLAFTLMRAIGLNFTVWEFLVIGIMFRTVSKFPLINVNYGNLESLFFDNLFEPEFQLMFKIQNESGVRPTLPGKFEEYIIPSMAVNAIIIQMGCYFVSFILNILGYFMKNRVGRFFKLVHFGVMATTICDVLTYCLLEITNRNVQDDHVYYWIISLVMVIMVATDVL